MEQSIDNVEKLLSGEETQKEKQFSNRLMNIKNMNRVSLLQLLYLQTEYTLTVLGHEAKLNSFWPVIDVLALVAATCNAIFGFPKTDPYMLLVFGGYSVAVANRVYRIIVTKYSNKKIWDIEDKIENILDSNANPDVPQSNKE